MVEGAPDIADRRVAQLAVRQRHRDVVHLSDETHVGDAFDAHAGGVDISRTQLGTSLRLQLCEQRVETGGVEAAFEGDDA